MKYRYQIVAGAQQHSEVFVCADLMELLHYIEMMTMRFGIVDLVYNLGRA